jgi:hypothetical protein
MRPFMIGLAAALIARVAVGQSGMSLERYATLMQSNADAVGALRMAVEAGSYDDARVHVALLRRNFQMLRPFWSGRNRGDAVGIVSDGMSRLAALEELLGRSAVPEATVRMAAEEFGGAACGACHDVYREGDRETGFRFKQGVF